MQSMPNIRGALPNVMANTMANNLQNSMPNAMNIMNSNNMNMGMYFYYRILWCQRIQLLFISYFKETISANQDQINRIK